MTATVDTLHNKLHGFLEHAFFKTIIGLLIFMNPLALVPGVWAAFTAPSVEGISPTMWILFALIQAAVTLEGIRLKSVAMFYSMLASFLLSVTLIMVVLVRG